VHNSCYLVLGEEKALLFDSSDPLAWRSGLESAIDGLLGDRQLDYVVPSHQEIPHCGNSRRLLAKFPDARVVGDIRDYHVLFPNEADRLVAMEPGTRLDLGGGEAIVLLPAILKDLRATQWVYAEREQVLFSADAFSLSHYAPDPDDERPQHEAGQCGLFLTEMTVPWREQIVWVTRATLYWSYFVPVDRFLPAFEQLLRERPARMIAPTHGNVIDDISLISEIWKEFRHAYGPADAFPAAAALPET
jgi:flavorubredoxin